MYYLEIVNSFDRIEIFQVDEEKTDEKGDPLRVMVFEFICGSDTERIVVADEARVMPDNDGRVRFNIH